MIHEIDHDKVHYLGFNKRFVAFLIDSTATSILMAPFVYLLIGDEVLLDKDFSNQSQLFELLGPMTIRLSVDLLFMGSIFILFWVYKNSTPGKMLFKSVIVDANTLSAPRTSQNITRYLGYFISFFPLGLGFLWIAFDKRKQGWHDKLAGTVVIIGQPRQLSAVQTGETDRND
jgi:uncharacterized RDD family membrane protein YckC